LKSRFLGSDKNIADIAVAAAESDLLILHLLESAGVKVEKAGDGFVVYQHDILHNFLVFNHVIADLMGSVGIYPSREKIHEVRKKFNTEKSFRVLYRGTDYEIVKDFRGPKKFLAARRIEKAGDAVWSSCILIKGDTVAVKYGDKPDPFEIHAAIVEYGEFELKKEDQSHIFIDVTDYDLIEIRSVLPGDRIVCGKMDRKIKRIMIDNKCSLSEKKSLPLFVGKGEILAAGFGLVERGQSRIADMVMVTKGSKKILDINRVCAEN
jgi:tRNA(Ile)-lysidine synthetase-like protein